jgi:hypothetical protein
MSKATGPEQNKLPTRNEFYKKAFNINPSTNTPRLPEIGFEHFQTDIYCKYLFCAWVWVHVSQIKISRNSVEIGLKTMPPFAVTHSVLSNQCEPVCVEAAGCPALLETSIKRHSIMPPQKRHAVLRRSNYLNR